MGEHDCIWGALVGRNELSSHGAFQLRFVRGNLRRFKCSCDPSFLQPVWHRRSNIACLDFVQGFHGQKRSTKTGNQNCNKNKYSKLIEKGDESRLFYLQNNF